MEFGTRIEFTRTSYDIWSEENNTPIQWRPGDLGRYICETESGAHLVYKDGGQQVYMVGRSEFKCVNREREEEFLDNLMNEIDPLGQG